MDILNFFFGIKESEYNSFQMILRSLIIYISAIAMVRLGNKRSLGENTAFDFLLGIILGSVLSRAINGGAALIPSILTCAFLILFHFVLSKIAYKTSGFGNFIKGVPRTLISDGKMQKDGMRRSNITELDLITEMRLLGHTGDISQIKSAYLERNGEISIIKYSQPKVIDVKVEEGVQTVRIKID